MQNRGNKILLKKKWKGKSCTIVYFLIILMVSPLFFGSETNKQVVMKTKNECKR